MLHHSENSVEEFEYAMGIEVFHYLPPLIEVKIFLTFRISLSQSLEVGLPEDNTYIEPKHINQTNWFSCGMVIVRRSRNKTWVLTKMTGAKDLLTAL